MKLAFDLKDAAPQGYRTVRFRARLKSGERIGHKGIQWVYVTKDWWREHGSAAVLDLEIIPVVEGTTVVPQELYRTYRGQNNHKLTNVTVEKLAKTAANQKHPVPYIYVTKLFAEEHGDPDTWIIRLHPRIPKL